MPGSEDDLKKILDKLATHRVDFAIKGGGHSTNPGFSSTTGVQISMALFNKIEYVDKYKVRLGGHGTEETEEKVFHVGAGCLFDELYRAVVPKGLNIVGGSSIGGVGVAGWLLGGGFSLKTNQFGLGIDNIVAIDIVLPKTEERGAELKKLRIDSDGEDKDLFNAIKGGGNNFGFVTKFTLYAHTQKKVVYGGLLTYEEEEVEDVKKAIVSFAAKTEPKAAIVAAFRYYNRPDGEDFQLTVQCFYDDKKPTVSDPFSEFLDIDHEVVAGGGDTVGFNEARPSFTTNVSAITGVIPQGVGDHQYVAQKISGSLGESSFISYDRKYSPVNSLLDQAPIDVGDFEVGFAHLGMTSKTDGSTFDSIPYVSSTSPYISGASSNTLSALKSYTEDPFKRGMAGVGENTRGRWGNVMVGQYTKAIVDEIERQAKKVAKHLVKHRGKTVVIDIWPFTEPIPARHKEAAWPHNTRNGPILVYFLWEGAQNDEFWINKMKKVLKAIKKKVGGADDRPLYMNTTFALGRHYQEAQVKEIYRGALDQLILKELRKKYDPQSVMNLTGGFRIPHPDGEVDDSIYDE